MKPIVFKNFFLACVAAWIPACAGMTAAIAPEAVYAEPSNQSQLTRIEQYLNSITTIVAEFNQVAPDGSLTSGKFFLKRPGKMRWQYDPPTPLLMVASGKEIVYYDYELQQVSHIPLDYTLAGFLAREHIDLHDPALVIKNVENSNGVVRVTLTQAGKEDEGSLMLEFSDNPLLIRNMVVTDAQGQVTTVSLNNARFGAALENKLFEFTDPRRKQRT